MDRGMNKKRKEAAAGRISVYQQRSDQADCSAGGGADTGCNSGDGGYYDGVQRRGSRHIWGVSGGYDQ